MTYSYCVCRGKATCVAIILQALRCALRGLEVDEGAGREAIEEQAASLALEYMEKFLSEHRNYFSATFIREALDILENVSNKFDKT